MNATPELVRLPASLQKEASRLAEEDGVSLSHWVSLAVAQKIGAVETAAEFFQRRARNAPGTARALEILDAGPNNPPDPGDELPEGYVPTHKR